ncbi:hypothetical protein BC834DRAFT_553742 [Gloeopeniophorella convolvens]|nr:hypothetical protein BC834DRAFT_553742 [Gloeopeniophorella convolvens]
MSHLEELLERVEKSALTDQDTRVLMCLALLQAIVELLLRAALVILAVYLVPIIISYVKPSAYALWANISALFSVAAGTLEASYGVKLSLPGSRTMVVNLSISCIIRCDIILSRGIRQSGLLPMDASQ